MENFKIQLKTVGWIITTQQLEKCMGKLRTSSVEDVEKAYQAAATAFLSWRQTTVDERSEILSKIADLILDKILFLAAAANLKIMESQLV